jgi:hypothetical protein
MWSSILAVALALAACGPANRGGGDGGPGDGRGNGDGGQQGCQGVANCYSVYAHSNDTLYVVDLMSKTLQTIGKFNSNNDNITDLAVAPDNTIYVVSETALYTASATDGHVTKIGSLATCGTKIVALTTLANGQIWTGDYSGALCRIDTTTNPPTVKAPVMMSGGLSLSGDLVALGDGTVFGSAYKIADGTTGPTVTNNLLVKIDMTTGATTQLGSTGYPKLFGVSFAQNQVIGFTHDGTGHVVAINPMTGAATLFATFMDPGTGSPISFAGAGVNSLVVIQ